ncbi:MAG TPA: hypothetical protein VMB74_01965 [Streptosporangiaceae bacterium]|nr:hypothetical protein [Streptosporangiaceae bacterium]
MRKKVTRAAGLAGLAAAATGAGVLAVAIGAATPALAGIEDTGGTASIAVSHSTVNGLARAGIVVLPAAPGGASVSRTGREIVTLPVSGGDGNFVGTSGTVDLAGGLVFTDGATRLSVTLTGLTFDYSTGNIGGVAGTRNVALVSVGGALSGSSSAGPPATQTFTASALLVTKAGARFLNSELHTKYFAEGRQIGSFATTYDTATTS